MEIWEVAEGETSIEGLLEDGSPDPDYAAALGLISAPLGRRAAAAAVDIGVYMLLQIPFWVGTAPLLLKFLMGRISAYGFTNHPHFKIAMIAWGATALLTTAYCIAQLAFHGSRGVTLGKSLFGLRAVNIRTLEQPGILKALVRALVVWGAGIVPFGSIAVLASPLFDKQGRGQGWHDRLGGTWLVDVNAGLDPYDEKRMRVARKTVAADPRLERDALPSLTTSPNAPAGPGYRPGSRLSAGVIGRAASDGGPAAIPGGSLATPAPPAAQPAPPEPAAPPAPVAPAPAPPAPAPPAPPPAPSSRAPQRVPASSGQQFFVLQFDTGQQVQIEGVSLLGRNPEPPDPTQVRPIRVVDEERSVSKAHLLVRPVALGIELIDRNSSNGTRLTHNGIERSLAAGEPALAEPGDTIHIGDRTATVRRG